MKKKEDDFWMILDLLFNMSMLTCVPFQKIKNKKMLTCVYFSQKKMLTCLFKRTF